MSIERLMYIISFVVVLGMVLLFSFFYYLKKTQRTRVEELVEKRIEFLILLEEMRANGLQMMAALRKVILTSEDEKAKRNYHEYFDKFFKVAQKAEGLV
ncbi:MAG: hypothetical protein N2511_07830 [Thermodesulfovibrionales bacterium]|nr:hypothetical protein [Thermodesulfovibrionales bacterium]